MQEFVLALPRLASLSGWSCCGLHDEGRRARLTRQLGWLVSQQGGTLLSVVPAELSTLAYDVIVGTLTLSPDGF